MADERREGRDRRQMQRGGRRVTDLRALTPLKWLHVNPYGTFILNMHERLPLEHAA